MIRLLKSGITAWTQATGRIEKFASDRFSWRIESSAIRNIGKKYTHRPHSVKWLWFGCRVGLQHHFSDGYGMICLDSCFFMSGEEEFQAGSGCYEDSVYNWFSRFFVRKLIFVYRWIQLNSSLFLHQISSHHGLFKKSRFFTSRISTVLP